MHFEAHASLGWVIGNAGRNDRRLRNWCVVGAVLPNVDAIPYVFGPAAYGRWHHTFGHSVNRFFDLLCPTCRDQSA